MSKQEKPVKPSQACTATETVGKPWELIHALERALIVAEKRGDQLLDEGLGLLDYQEAMLSEAQDVYWKATRITTVGDALDALGAALDEAGAVVTLNGKPMHKAKP